DRVTVARAHVQGRGAAGELRVQFVDARLVGGDLRLGRRDLLLRGQDGRVRLLEFPVEDLGLLGVGRDLHLQLRRLRDPVGEIGGRRRDRQRRGNGRYRAGLGHRRGGGRRHGGGRR